METDTTGFDSFADAVWAQLQLGIDHLPGLLAALLLLAVGWVIAGLARGAVQKLALASNRLLARAFPQGVLAGTRVSSLAATLFGEAVFWVIVLISITVAARVAGFSTLSVWLDRITAHLPNLVAGAVIVVVGYFLSVYVREQLAPHADAGRSQTSQLIGRVAQGFVIAAALIVGLDQIGIDVALLIGLAMVCAAALLIGLGTAFALGARSHVGNLIGARAARRHLSVGLRIRIDEFEGEILEITPTQIALVTDDGKLLLPAGVVDEMPVIILAPETSQDGANV